MFIVLDCKGRENLGNYQTFPRFLTLFTLILQNSLQQEHSRPPGNIACP